MNAGDTASALSQVTLDQIVENTSDLPALPTAAVAVMKESQAPNATAHSVARCLLQDQALTTRVLRLANSAFYGMQRKVSSPDEAVVVLGMRSVRNLAMIASTYNWIDKPLLAYSLEPKSFWEHSIGVAVASQVVAQQAVPGARDLAFVCGLLHDLGKVALSAWLERHSVAMSSLAVRLNVPIDQAEQRVLGFDHQQVGSRLAEAWNFPKALVDSIGHHHGPNEASPDTAMADVVHVANYLVSTGDLAHGGDGLRYILNNESLDRLRIKAGDLEDLYTCVGTAYDQFQPIFQESAQAA